MAEKERDIRDDEFRIIGHPSQVSSENPHRRKGAIALVSAILVIAIGLLAIWKWPKNVPEVPNGGVYEGENTPSVQNTVSQPFGHETDKVFTEKVDTMVNDIPLSLYIPHNAIPSLYVGTLDVKDSSIVLAAQAADIRADNLEILGSFVLRGEVLARGESKKGYCAIIDGEITIGKAENSPLFEKATEKGGFFFRQYPLVNNGVLVEGGPKGKSLRRALCSRSGEVFVVVSDTNESFHDFSQALVDLGVENAIYLVAGRLAYGWYVDAEGKRIMLGEDVYKYNNESYILWQ